MINDDEYCELHDQDANECEALDPLNGEANDDYAGCRHFRWQQYIRGELDPMIVDAAIRHFRSPDQNKN